MPRTQNKNRSILVHSFFVSTLLISSSLISSSFGAVSNENKSTPVNSETKSIKAQPLHSAKNTALSKKETLVKKEKKPLKPSTTKRALTASPSTSAAMTGTLASPLPTSPSTTAAPFAQTQTTPSTQLPLQTQKTPTLSVPSPGLLKVEPKNSTSLVETARMIVPTKTEAELLAHIIPEYLTNTQSEGAPLVALIYAIRTQHTAWSQEQCLQEFRVVVTGVIRRGLWQLDSNQLPFTQFKTYTLTKVGPKNWLQTGAFNTQLSEKTQKKTINTAVSMLADFNSGIIRGTWHNKYCSGKMIAVINR